MPDIYGYDDKSPPLTERIVVTPDGLESKLREITAAVTQRSSVEVEYVDDLGRHMIHFYPQSIQQTNDKELFINGYTLDDEPVAYLRTESNGLIVHMNR